MQNGRVWLGGVALLTLALGVATHVFDRNPARAAQQSAALAPMDRARFWEIIHRTTAHKSSMDGQAAALRKELDSLTAAEIAAFEGTFGQIMRESYSWDLWGAAYVINGGASDDGFEYFRRWLISNGQAFYRSAVNDPDSLAGLLAPNSTGPFEFEEFAYIARDVWSAKTGRDGGEMPAAIGTAPYAEPSGQPFKEDETHLATRYPKLWKRFGRNPAL